MASVFRSSVTFRTLAVLLVAMGVVLPTVAYVCQNSGTAAMMMPVSRMDSEDCDDAASAYDSTPDCCHDCFTRVLLTQQFVVALETSAPDVGTAVIWTRVSIGDQDGPNQRGESGAIPPAIPQSSPPSMQILYGAFLI